MHHDLAKRVICGTRRRFRIHDWPRIQAGVNRHTGTEAFKGLELLLPLLSVRTVKQLALCAILLVMPIRSPVLTNRARSFISSSLADQPQVRTALDWLSKNLKWIDDAQVSLTEIPAPSFQEERRAEAVRDILATEGLTIHTERSGT